MIRKALPALPLALILTAQATAQEAPSGADWDAYIAALRSATPEQLMEARRLLEERQKASTERLNGPAEGVAKTFHLRFRGGVASTEISLVTDHLTALSIYDRLNNPWPIESIIVSNLDQFEVMWEGNGTHSFTLKSLQPFAEGNAVIRLKDAADPVIIGLATQKVNFFEKANLIISSLAPGISVATETDAPSLLSRSNTDRYYAFLDGRAPTGSVPVAINHPAIVEAWKYDGELLVLSSEPLMGLIEGEFKSIDDLTLYVFSDSVGEFGIPAREGGVVLMEIPDGR